MSVTSQVTISAYLQSQFTGNQVPFGPVTITGSNGIGEVLPVNILSGANTITIPANSTWCLFTPPSGNSASLTLKGVTGDTGVPMQPAQPSCFSVAPGASAGSMVITAGSAVGVCQFIFGG